MWLTTGVRRRSASVAVAAVVLGGVLVADTAPAFAHPSRVLIVSGRGWGHGRGLGQWGARGMAERGADWRRILTHYYRGVRIARERSVDLMRVRVQVSRASIVWSDAPFVVAFDGRRVPIRGRERTVRVRRVGSIQVVDRAPGRAGPWRRVARARGSIVIEAGRGALWLHRPGGGLRAYQRALVIRPRGEQLATVNHATLESYVASVLPREMPASWHVDALRAQAVAARTYAVNAARRARAAGKSYDICASTGCQVFGGIGWRRSLRDRPTFSTHPRATGAVRTTGRRVMTYRGRPIFAQYSSSTGGFTDRGDAPYLRAVPDPADRISPHHTWRAAIGAPQIEDRFPEVGRVRRVRVLARNGAGAWGGRVRRLVIEGTEGRVGMSGDRFQAVFDLRSDLFALRWRGALFTRTLREGSRGHIVRDLQDRLRQEGVYPRSAPRSNYFGPITRESVKRYQRAHGIRATGVLGPVTRRSLNRSA